MTKFKALIFIILLGSTQIVMSAPAPTHNVHWYYEIGGASTLSPPASDSVVLAELGADASWGMGFSCGSFDLSASFQNMFSVRNIRQQVDETLSTTATGVLAGLGGYIMQRIDPGLKQIFTNQLEFMRGKVELHKKSCEEVQTSVMNGGNPLRGLISLSMSNNWNNKLLQGESDIVSIDQSVKYEGGLNGIPWVHGNQGGRGQLPISMIGDTAFAGYNLIHGRSPSENTPIASSNITPLSTVFPTPESAKNWVVEVLGDIQSTTCSGDHCTPHARPGVGLLPKHKEESNSISSDLATLMTSFEGGVRVTVTDLEVVSSSGTAITKDVLYALHDLPPAEKSLVQNKIADEVALSRTMDKALLARRMLISGRMVPNIQASSDALKVIDNQIDQLNKEIENLMLEQRVRKEIVSSTLLSLLRHHKRESSRSRNFPLNHPYEAPAIIDGAPQ